VDKILVCSELDQNVHEKQKGLERAGRDSLGVTSRISCGGGGGGGGGGGAEGGSGGRGERVGWGKEVVLKHIACGDNEQASFLQNQLYSHLVW